LSKLLLKQERWAEAQATFKKALLTDPNSPEIHLQLGFVLAKQRQLSQAATYFEKALKLRPGDPDAQRNLTIIQGLINGGQ
jgi:Flp pilus assembly protein TadD